MCDNLDYQVKGSLGGLDDASSLDQSHICTNCGMSLCAAIGLFTVAVPISIYLVAYLHHTVITHRQAQSTASVNKLLFASGRMKHQANMNR